MIFSSFLTNCTDNLTFSKEKFQFEKISFDPIVKIAYTEDDELLGEGGFGSVSALTSKIDGNKMTMNRVAKKTMLDGKGKIPE